MNACPACGGQPGDAFLRRSQVPVHQNLLCATASEARAVSRGEIELAQCGSCDLVFNACFDVSKLRYEETYDSNQSHSAVFLAHVNALVERLVADGVRGRQVVEVGCGSGYFLRRLCERGGNNGRGYDPGYRGPEREPNSRATFVRGLFSPDLEPQAEVLVCRHVIEHVPRPGEFVRALSAGASFSSCYFETPSFEWIVEQAAVWDVFYEHCNYFTARALEHSLRLGGMEPLSIEPVFGGQYFWACARHGAEPSASAPALAGTAEFGRRCLAVQREQTAFLTRLAGAGRVAVWGAAAKGATYVNLLDPGAELVRCLTDINPARQGRFVPGSGHPIVPPPSLRELAVTDVIVMNPNYAAEIRGQLASLGLAPRVHEAAL